MIVEEVKHYTAYKPRPFLRKERKDVTVLYGGLTWKHERIIQGAFHNLGYKAEPMPDITRTDLDTGKELIDVGACCPTTFVTGSLVNFLKSEVEQQGREGVVDNYVYITAGACGACRFGQYHQSYTMALEMLGLKDFRILQFAQDEMDQGDVEGGGLEVNMAFSLGAVWATLCGDLLTDLEYMTRPYEVVPGQTDQVLKESVEYLYEVFRDRPLQKGRWRTLAWHFTTDYFTAALREVKKKWDTIEVDRMQVKPKVKVTGEFWLQTHEGEGNYNIKKWLEQEGAEIMAPPIAVWFDYWLRFFVQAFEEQKDVDRYVPLKIAGVKSLQWIYRKTYNRFRKALGNLTYEMPDQYELQKLAAPFYDKRLSGGEGDMLVGKALHAYHHNSAHMICELSPYSCMPNTMSIGAMANVTGQYPDLLYAPIEIKGDSEVHALSRCQMILTEAKKRAQQEFEEVVQKTELAVDLVHQYEEEYPKLKKITHFVPHNGVAGTAAGYMLSLADKI